METVHIFDTTLRDGEQSPGFSMNCGEKLVLARQLEQLHHGLTVELVANWNNSAWM